MANRNILNKVKTASGYDTLYPMTPYQIHYASNVSGTSSAYQVTIPFPAANITVPIIVYFKPVAQNSANCTISVNGLGAKTLYVNKTEGNENISVWDEEKDEYKVVANKTYSISAEEIAAMFND
jgi:hypothetical protein